MERIARSDDLGAVDAEVSLHGSDADRLGAIERFGVTKLDVDGAAGAELMAMRAVHVQVRPGPGLKRAVIEWSGERRRQPAAVVLLEFDQIEAAEMVDLRNLRAIEVDRALKLVRREGEREA